MIGLRMCLHSSASWSGGPACGLVYTLCPGLPGRTLSPQPRRKRRGKPESETGHQPPIRPRCVSQARSEHPGNFSCGAHLRRTRFAEIYVSTSRKIPPALAQELQIPLPTGPGSPGKFLFPMVPNKACLRRRQVGEPISGGICFHGRKSALCDRIRRAPDGVFESVPARYNHRSLRAPGRRVSSGRIFR